MSLGAVIRRRRRAGNITIWAMAHLLQIPVSVVSDIELDRRGIHELETLLKLCQVLGTDPTTLLKEGGMWI